MSTATQSKFPLTPTNLIAFGLLLFIPAAIWAEKTEMDPLIVFGVSAIAIVPLAMWLSTATEEVAVITGPNIGGLLNAVFGNATELIIALVALKAGLVEVVKASITGALLANLLLVMGLAMVVGGIKYKEQKFASIVARINGSTMTLAVTALVLPALLIKTSTVVAPETITHLSMTVAVVLLVVYALTLVFSLKTHSYLYDVGVKDLDVDPDAVTAGEHSEKPSLWLWAGVLLVATVGVAFVSEIFVAALEEATATLGFTSLFSGVILVPLVGGAAEYLTAVRVAAKDNMDLAISISMGSSLLVALLIVPTLVLVGQAIGQPMDLNFNLFEVVAIVIAVALVNLISLDGRSNWLEGVLLLATFVILGTAFYFHPA
ncbi:MAG: calcium/proton exchanger [Leptolyngbyaceae cyanobacterium]